MVDDRLVVLLQRVRQTADHVQLVLSCIHDLLLLLLVLVHALLHHLHTTRRRLVLRLHRLNALRLHAQRLILLLDRLELRQEARARLLDALVRVRDVLRAREQLLVLLVQLLLQLRDLLVQRHLQHARLLLLLVDLRAVRVHQLLHLLLLLRHLLLARLQLRLLLVDLAHHRSQARVVARRLVVQLLHVRLVLAVHHRVRVVEGRDHRVDRHQLRLDLVHAHLRRLAVALRALHDLRALRVHLALDGLRAVGDFLGLRVVLRGDGRRLRGLALHQLVLQGRDLGVHALDVLAHLALALVQTNHLATKLVRNLHELLTSSHQRVLRGSRRRRRSRRGRRSGRRGRSSYDYTQQGTCYQPKHSCHYAIRESRTTLTRTYRLPEQEHCSCPYPLSPISCHKLEHIASLRGSIIHTTNTMNRLKIRYENMSPPSAAGAAAGGAASAGAASAGAAAGVSSLACFLFLLPNNGIANNQESNLLRQQHMLTGTAVLSLFCAISLSHGNEGAISMPSIALVFIRFSQVEWSHPSVC